MSEVAKWYFDTSISIIKKNFETSRFIYEFIIIIDL